MKLKKRFKSAATCMLASFVLAAGLPEVHAAPINFNFLIQDAPGTGFLDPVFGQQALATLNTAGKIWGSLLQQSYSGETITVAARFVDTPPSGFPDTFGGAGGATAIFRDFSNAVPGTWYDAALANHLAGTDLLPVGSPTVPSGAEMGLTLNAQQNYFFGTEGIPAPGQFDFLTTILHEIGHGLGFDSEVNADGSLGPGGDGRPSIYDRFVVDEFGTPIIAMTNEERLAAVTDFQGLFWSGPNAVSALGGIRPGLAAAEGVFSAPVSIVHFSPSFFLPLGRDDILMLPDVTLARTPDEVTLGVLADIGWNVVPEPSMSYLLAIGMFAMLLFQRRRAAMLPHRR